MKRLTVVQKKLIRSEAGDIKVEGDARKLGEMIDEIVPDLPIVEPLQAKP